MVSVVITGPESTGKSRLTIQLAEYFNGYLIEEYARSYVENLNRSYTFEDVEKITSIQVQEYLRIKSAALHEDYAFFDTFLLITKVWFEEVFECCPVWLNHEIKTCKPDLALLCAPDLPWEADGVRENGHLRQYLFDRYKEELEFYSIPFHVVEGGGVQRFQNALKCVDSFIGTKKSEI
ncbi:AAA family ATPase [Marinilabilia rubra]|uniref:ATPase n=1 Tax=Marinilabilia rubra TaxID=2162893 RepID=A0A2U2B6L1_9BACT|nr:ATP-binding protein [Marinilabilia rubra]PWD98686.1 ATPase [Marinilabilia rubra]